MASESLENILKTIREDTAYFLYLHAGDRPDYSDYKPEDEIEYIRAIHGAPKDEKIVKVLEDIYYNARNTVFSPSYYNESKANVRDAAGKIAILNYGPAKLTKSKEVIERKTVKKWFGLKTETHERRHYEDYEEKVKLSDLKIGADEDAYLVMLSVDGRYLDNGGRVPGIPASVCIVTNKENAKMIVEYVKKKPTDYYNILEAMFPEKEFRNVNGNVIKKIKKRHGITFVNMEDGERSEASMLEKELFTEEMLVEKEAVLANPFLKAFFDLTSSKYSYSKGDMLYYYSDGIPIEHLLKKIDKSELTKFPKALQLRATWDGVKVSLDSKIFGEYLYRGVNGHDGDRGGVCIHDGTYEIIKSYIKNDHIFTTGAGSHYGKQLTTSDNLHVPFTGDRWGSFISPSGHLVILQKEESDKVNGINALGEVLLTDVPNNKVKFIFAPADDVDKLKEEHEIYKGFDNHQLEEVIIPHPWTTQETFIKNMLPEVMVLTANEKGLAYPRYKSEKEFQEAIKRVEERCKEDDIAYMKNDEWKVINVD